MLGGVETGGGGGVISDGGVSVGTESQVERQTPQGGGVCLEDPQDGWVIVSQPGQHSRKPFVGHLLSRHLPCLQPLQDGTLLGEPAGANDFKGIELFARELRSGWMCLGDQVSHLTNMIVGGPVNQPCLASVHHWYLLIWARSVKISQFLKTPFRTNFSDATLIEP